MPPNQMHDLIVIGAGLSGLTSAYHAKRSGHSVLVLEKSARAGGVIRSEKKDGYLLEYGPNTVQPNRELVDLVNDLGLSEQTLWADPRAPRFVQFKDELHPVPMSPKSLATTSLLSWSGRMRVLREPFVSVGDHPAEETVAQFFARRFGNEVMERLVAPFVSGIWAGDAETLSVQSAFPRLVEWERTHGSVIKGLTKKKKQPGLPKGLLSFPQGLSTLTEALTKSLGDSLLTNVQIVSTHLDGKDWLVKTSAGDFKCRKLLFATPAHQAARFIENVAPAASQALLKIPYASVAVLHLAAELTDIGRSLNGFGFLVAPSEKASVLGCLWNSSLFPGRAPRGRALLTVFMGGATRPELLEASVQELLKRAVSDLQKVLRLKKHPDLVSLVRIHQAIPQYNLGHVQIEAELQKAEKDFPGLFFGGNYRGGISVGDVVRSARRI